MHLFVSCVSFNRVVCFVYFDLIFYLLEYLLMCSALHLCRPVRSTFAVRETASLGIMGAPRVPPLNPSESIVL